MKICDHCKKRLFPLRRKCAETPYSLFFSARQSLVLPHHHFLREHLFCILNGSILLTNSPLNNLNASRFNARAEKIVDASRITTHSLPSVLGAETIFSLRFFFHFSLAEFSFDFLFRRVDSACTALRNNRFVVSITRRNETVDVIATVYLIWITAIQTMGLCHFQPSINPNISFSFQSFFSFLNRKHLKNGDKNEESKS